MIVTVTAWERLEELREAVRDAEARIAELDAEQRQAGQAYRKARAAELEHLRAVEAGELEADPDAAEALTRALGEAAARVELRPTARGGGEVHLEPVDERIEARIAGARVALEARREAVDEYLRGEFDALAGELAEEARAARDAVEQALPVLLDAEARFRRVRARWRPVLRANGLPFDLPPNPLRGFADDVDPAAGVPLPVPVAFLGERD